MFNALGSSEAFYGVRDIVPADGGIQMEISDDEEEEEEVKQMEMEPLGQGIDAIEHVELFVFPHPTPLLEYQGAHLFRFDINHVPAEFTSLPPHVMLGLSAYTEEIGKHKMAAVLQPALPIIVHASPLVSLFSSKAALPPGAPPPKGGFERAWKEKYVSYMFSVFQLHQLFVICSDGIIKPTREFHSEHLAHAKLEWGRQMRMAEEHQNRSMDELYARVVAGHVDKTQAVAEFATLMERYTYQYIHLLEYFIYTCLIEPHCPTLPLEAVLTPLMEVHLDQCAPNYRDRVLRDTDQFFRFKVLSRQAQEVENEKAGIDNVDIKPIVHMLPDTVERQVRAKGQMYRGHLPLQTLYEYFCWYDSDGVLRDGQWQ